MQKTVYNYYLQLFIEQIQNIFIQFIESTYIHLTQSTNLINPMENQKQPQLVNQNLKNNTINESAHLQNQSSGIKKQINNIDLDNNYTQSYVDTWVFFKSLQIQNSFTQQIIDSLPQQYEGIDVGSCDAKLGQTIMKAKKGKIISIDPYPLVDSVVQTDGLSFFKQNNKLYDCIIFRYAVHFFDFTSEFYPQISRALKPTGKIHILALSPTSYFPWTDKINQAYINSCKNFSGQTYPNHKAIQTILVEEKKIKREDFITFVTKRGFSHLLLFTDDEIKQQVQKIPHTQYLDVKLKYVLLELGNKLL